MVSGGVIAVIVISIILVIVTVILLIYFLVIKKSKDPDPDKDPSFKPLDIKATGGDRGKQIIDSGPITIITGVSEFANAVTSYRRPGGKEKDIIAVLKNPLEDGNCDEYKLIYDKNQSTITASWLPENNNYLKALGTKTRSGITFGKLDPKLSKWSFDNFPGTLYKRLQLLDTELYLYHNPGTNFPPIGQSGSPKDPKDNILYVATKDTENPNGYTWIVTEPIGPSTKVLTCKPSPFELLSDPAFKLLSDPTQT